MMVRVRLWFKHFMLLDLQNQCMTIAVHVATI